MSDKHYRVSYPISEEVKAALLQYPIIADRIKLPDDGCSDLEIVRLLDNQHYPWIKQLTHFIEDLVPSSGEIGKKVLDSKDPFQFAQAKSELYLFNWIRQHIGDGIEPASIKRGQSGWDITATVNGHELRFEVYTPIELAGYQLFDRLLKSTMKYLDISIGYVLDVNVGIQRSGLGYNQRDLFYVYEAGNQEFVNQWLFGFEKQLRSWIKCKSLLKRKNQQLTIPGPGDRLKVTINIIEWLNHDSERHITIGWPTKSSDTKLFFENKNPGILIKNEWGKKIRQKMYRKQCGEPSKDYTRILVLNFMLADAGWPEFISERWFTTNFNNLINYIGGESQPYDVVLPAQLGIESCFGEPVWIDDYYKENHDYIEQLGLSIMCEPTPEASQEEIDEIVKDWDYPHE